MSNNQIVDKNFFSALGIKDDFSETDINKILVLGPESSIFLTKVGSIFITNTTLEKNNQDLVERNQLLLSEINELRGQIIVLQLSEANLKKDIEFLINQNQNSVTGTVLFAIGSIFVGICGSTLSIGSYLTGAITGLIGVSLSVIAARLINIQKGGKANG